MDSFKKSWMSRVGIVVIAAVIVEAISIMQYGRIRGIMKEEMDMRSRLAVNARAQTIEHALDLAETTMHENLHDVRSSMAHPDSVFPAMVRLINDNPLVMGGCLAFSPDYYPSKGRLFEPYAIKQKDGTITVSQIAGPDHDYTRNEEYLWVLEHKTPSWTDPYSFGPDSLDLATYSYPIMDARGDIIAVCGIDIDLSWLGDTLNARQPSPSSFAIMLTQEGDLVTGPSESRISPLRVEEAVSFVNGELPESAKIDFEISKTKLRNDPYWQVVEIYRPDEAFARMRKMRANQAWFILVGMLIMFFLIDRFARNEKKLRQASEEQARIGGELMVASRIQQEMLPKVFPSFVNGSLEPAREVGGDLFDFFVRDGKLFFCIGDVSGKGVPAAMLMSMIRSLFRLLTQKIESPSRILDTLNKELCRSNDANMFITFFMGCLDLYSGVLRFGNAGHDKPFLVSEDMTLLPAQSHLPLGVFPNTAYEDQTLVLAPGTTLFLYTDGLTEAKNEERKPFGRSGVIKVLKAFMEGKDPSLENLVSSMSKAAHRFAGEAPQSDDLTMLAVRFAPENVLHEEIVLQNNVEEVTRLSAFVKGFLGKLEMDRKIAAGLRLAVEETAVNVINYAYPEGETGTLTILADTNHQEVRFTLIDNGTPFDPTTVLEADTTLDAQNRPIGGLGVLLTRRLTDSISYTRQEGQNVLTLTKSIL